MFNHETGLMDRKKFGEFVEFFDNAIGTDYEVNEDPAGSNKVYVVCFELENKEVTMICDWEDSNL